jgi:hypothetical protein
VYFLLSAPAMIPSGSTAPVSSIKIPTGSPAAQLSPPFVVRVPDAPCVACPAGAVCPVIPAMKLAASPAPFTTGSSSCEQPPERSSPASSAPPQSVRAAYLKIFSVLIFSLFIIYIIRLPKKQCGFS